MRKLTNRQQFVALTASGLKDAKLHRRGEDWIVVGRLREDPKMFAARQVSDVVGYEVWWLGGWGVAKLRRDAIEQAGA